MADCKVEKLVRKQDKRIPAEYVLSLGEIDQLYDIYTKNNIFIAFVFAYNLGVIRGTRARDRNRCPVL